MQFTRSQIIFIAIGGLSGVILLLILFGVLPGRREDINVTEITVWGVEDTRVFQTITRQFEKLRPDVSISYRQFEEDTYERDLLNNLAAGEKPDVVMFENNWLLEHQDKLLPATFTIGTAGQAQLVEKFTLSQMQTFFPRVAEQDFTIKNEVYALPLYIDTLAMAYNRDLFDKGGVVFPPTTWEELGNTVGKLKLLEGNELSRGAYAIGGTSKSVFNTSDIIQAMLLQGGVDMINAKHNLALFGESEGKAVFEIYTRFSDPSSNFYSWNDSMQEATESFTKGDVTAIFIYSKEIRDLKARNSFLDIGVAPLPQLNTIEGVTIADYWGLSVFNGSIHPLEAWDFVVFATTNEEATQTYLDLTGNPPALRGLIEKNLDNPELGVFTRQSLVARSWLQPGEEVLRLAFDEAMNLVLSKELTPSKGLQRAAAIVTEALQKIE